MSLMTNLRGVVACISFVAFFISQVSGKCRDTPGIEIFDEISRSWANCSSSIAKRTGLCYRYKERCCLSCSKYKRADKPKCPYGDTAILIYNYKTKRSETCEEMITNETKARCYFKTTKKQCCETCANFKKPTVKGCEYGDRYGQFIRAHQLWLSCSQAITDKSTAGLCYVYKDDCCDTCAKYKSNKKRCEYGDRIGPIVRFYSSILPCSQAIVDENTSGYCYHYKDACCETCAKYKSNNKNCEYGDQPGIISYVNNKQYTCGKLTKGTRSLCHRYERRCCKTCRKLRSSDNAKCPYGDTDYNLLYNAHPKRYKTCEDIITNATKARCYSNSTERRCCETCVKYKNPAVNGCEYGNHPGKRIYINRKRYTCGKIANRTRGLCYRYERYCCETCRKLRSLDNGCVYGDHPGRLIDINRKRYTCAKITNGTRNLCYRYEKYCCETCRKLRSLDNAKCPYGDMDFHGIYNFETKRYEACKVITDTTKGRCYSPSAKHICCITCARYKNPAVKGCEYGDRYGQIVRTNSSRLSCSQAIVDESTAGLCYQYKHYCCETCAKYKSDNKDCEYGDKPGKIIQYGKMNISCKEALRINRFLCKQKGFLKYCCKSCQEFST